MASAAAPQPLADDTVIMDRVDEELRAAMIEAQAKLSRFTTDMKRDIDSRALQAQRTLEDDKENVASKRVELAAGLRDNEALQQRVYHR